MKFRVTVDGRQIEIEVGPGRRIWVDGQPMYVHMEQLSRLPVYSLALDDAGYVVFVEQGPGQYQVEVEGRVLPVQVEVDRPAAAVSPLRAVSCGPEGSRCEAICAPLPGRLVSLPVPPGQSIIAGQVAAVVESMKMQMELRTPGDGVVDAVYGPPGRNVAQGEELVVIRPIRSLL